MDADDLFLLPSNSRHGDIQLKRLRSTLSDLKKKKLDLKNKLAEEKLTYLMTTSFATAIPDPRKQKAMDMKQVQEEIMEQLTAATQSRQLQEVLSGFRLCGWTTFTFQHDFTVLRFDTFYNRQYHEPYYLFFRKGKPSTISNHTLPPFIPITEIAKVFLPDRIGSLLRILQDFLLAYVSRREQFNALESHIKKRTVKIKAHDAANMSISITQPQDDGLKFFINIRYKDFASMYPSEVTVNVLDRNHNPHNAVETKTIANIFKSKCLLQAYTSLF